MFKGSPLTTITMSMQATIQDGPHPAPSTYQLLYTTCHKYPAIDSHAHPLLTVTHRNVIPFEGLISEAEGPALEDSVHTLPCYRATTYLGKLFGLKGPEMTWDQVKIAREQMAYEDLCTLSFRSTKIQCILLDDRLKGVEELAEEYRWHDSYTTSPTKRIVRIESVAEVVLYFTPYIM